MEKGLSIDAGRKFWPVDFLKSVLELMSDLSMTHLQLIFSDVSVFQTECLKFPEFATADDYTRAEIVELIRFAAERGIEIVPGFDSPGHLAGLLKQFPDYALVKSDGKRDLSALDVTNPQACRFIFGLYDELADLFPSKYFHIGADEFIPFDEIAEYPQLKGKLDAFVDFVNQLVERLSKKSKICRVWNDGFYRKSPISQSNLTSQAEICYWSSWDKDMASVKTWLNKGYQLINFCDNYLYYVLGENAGYTYPTVEKLEKFSPDLFSGGQKLSLEEMKSLLGCYFAVWSDIPSAKTADALLSDLTELLPVFVRKINDYEKKYFI